MTTITIYKSNNVYRRFTCKGHSGYASSGKDIVCASVSILVFNAINSLDEIADQNFDLTEDESTGYIDCRLDSNVNEKTVILLDSMVLGLKAIEEQYGKYLRLKFEEV